MVIFYLTARKSGRSAVIWGYIFGISIASSAISYTTLYKTQAQRDALAAAYGSNKATSALFGPAPALQSVAGFTAFKVSMTLAVVGAGWGLLTSTRLLRGEEDSGRWELLLAGQTNVRKATSSALGGLAVGAIVIWFLTTLITALAGLDSKVHIPAGAAAYFALAMVATALMFLAVGALTSQFGATRRQAATYGAVFLGISYATRMIADAGVGLHALIWASPIGWVEQLQPLTAPQPLALLPIAIFVATLSVAAVQLAGIRDVGSSLVDEPSTPQAHLSLLRTPTGLAVRMVRPTVVAWWAAIAVAGLLYGFISKSAGATISGSSVQKVFSKLGAPGSGVSAVLGVCFVMGAAPLE
jgi:ABC-2 type transport system permease protein